jgi:thioredoxin reductase
MVAYSISTDIDERLPVTLIDLMTPPVRDPRLDGLPIAIIGAGPVGLAAAANLVERGIDFVLLETGEHAAASVRAWGHTRLFSPWSELIDPAARRLLTAAGWTAPVAAAPPTGRELVEHYLAPLAALDPIARRLRLGAAVDAVSRQGMDRTRSARREQTPFVLRVTAGGVTEEVTARAVIDVSGTYTTSNSVGASGLDPLGLAEVRDLVTPALPDVLGNERSRFAGAQTVVVGAGHSAANTLIALAALAEQEAETSISWVIRNPTAVRVIGSADDELPGRASLGARVQSLVASGAITVVDRFEIIGLARVGDRVEITGNRAGGVETLSADLIVNATGFRPELRMLREIRLDLDAVVEAPTRLAPLIDPNVHSCGTVEPHGFTELQHPEPNFFLAGMKSYGRAPTFLLATGYEQVRSITAYLAGDLDAARAVELVLPATGVCSTDVAASCCS